MGDLKSFPKYEQVELKHTKLNNYIGILNKINFIWYVCMYIYIYTHIFKFLYMDNKYVCIVNEYSLSSRVLFLIVSLNYEIYLKLCDFEVFAYICI